MTKLINVNFIKAEGMICVWREDALGKEGGFECGICLESAEADYMIPKYVVVGVFDDGTVKAGGILNFGMINHCEEDDSFFFFNEFLHRVDIDAAKAFIRYLTKFGRYKNDEFSAKNSLLSDLLSSGVEISAEAKEYLTII